MNIQQQDGGVNHHDDLLILSSASSICTKTFTRTAQGWKKIGFSAGTIFDVRVKNIASLRDLHHVLASLEDDRHAFLVRGALSPRSHGHKVRRRCNGPDADFMRSARRWLCVDLDNIPLPEDADFASQKWTGTWLRWYIATLPAPLRDISCVAQFSASTAISPKIGLHLWFWLDRPICDESLRAWARTKTSEGYPIDPALYTPVQPHYTAAPIIQGAKDPLCRRLWYVIRAQETVQTPSEWLDHEAWTAQEEENARQRAQEEARKALQRARQERRLGALLRAEEIARSLYERAIEDVASAPPPGGGGYAPLRGAIMRAAAIVRGGFVVADDLRSDVLRLAQGRDSATLGRLIDGALEKATPFVPSSSEKSKKNGKKKEKSGGVLITRYARESAVDSEQESSTWGCSTQRESSTKDPLCGTPKKEERDQRDSFVLGGSGTPLKKEAVDEPPRLPPIPPSAPIIAVCAPLGSGKSYQANALTSTLKRVLWIVQYRNLARDVAARYGLTCYLDVEGPLVSNRLVVCVDSLGRVSIDPARGPFDLVIVDEANETLTNLTTVKPGSSDVTPIGERVRRARSIFEAAKHVLLLDAHLWDASIDTVCALSGARKETDVHFIEQPAPPLKGERWRFFERGEDVKARIFAAIKKEEKVAICCTAQKTVKTLEKQIKKRFPDRRVLAIHGDPSDEARASLTNVNVAWSQYDILLYNTAAGAGVSFDGMEYFDRVAVVADNVPGMSGEAILQMVGRIRHPRDREVCAWIADVQGTPKTRDELEAQLRDREAAHFELRAAWGADGKIEYHEGNTLAIEAHLLQRTAREQTSAWTLETVCAHLLRRGVPIIQGASLSKSARKKLREEAREARADVEKERIAKVARATPITDVEASEIKKNTLAEESERRSLERHEIGTFYGSTRTEDGTIGDVPPATIERDAEGERRIQISRMVAAMGWRLSKDFFLEKDENDVVYSVDENGTPRENRSQLDAREHALRASWWSDVLVWAEEVHPQLSEALMCIKSEQESSTCRCSTQRSSSTKDPLCGTPIKDERDQQDRFVSGGYGTGDEGWVQIEDTPEARERVTALLKISDRKHRLAARGLSPSDPPNKVLGTLLAEMGVVRDTRRRRVNGKLVREYRVDLASLRSLTQDALPHARRMGLEIAAHLGSESDYLVGMGWFNALPRARKKEVRWELAEGLANEPALSSTYPLSYADAARILSASDMKNYVNS